MIPSFELVTQTILSQTTFHSPRHWKATTEHHKTKGIIHVKRLLGHRRVESTMKYTHLVSFDNPDEFTCRVAKTLEAAKELIEAGFEYVTDTEDSKLSQEAKVTMKDDRK